MSASARRLVFIDDILMILPGITLSPLIVFPDARPKDPARRR